MDPALIVRLVTLGADLLSNGLKAYEANKAAFSTQDQEAIRQALATVSAINDVKEAAALAALDQAATE